MEKTQKRLSRTELLQLLAKTSEVNEALATENETLKKALSDRPELPRTLKVGSIAEAALVANGYFESAQQAADDYLREIKRLRDRLVEKNASVAELQEQLQDRLRQAREDAEAGARVRELEAAAHEAEARAREADMQASEAAGQLQRAQAELGDVQGRRDVLQAEIADMQRNHDSVQVRLQEAQQDYELLQAQVRDMQQRLEALRVQAHDAQQRNEGLQLQAEGVYAHRQGVQDPSTSAEAQAREEAAAIVSNAREQANSIVTEANRRAEAIVAQAERQAAKDSHPLERSDGDMLTEKIMRRGRHVKGGYQLGF